MNEENTELIFSISFRPVEEVCGAAVCPRSPWRALDASRHRHSHQWWVKQRLLCPLPRYSSCNNQEISIKTLCVRLQPQAAAHLFFQQDGVLSFEVLNSRIFHARCFSSSCTWSKGADQSIETPP